MSDNCAPVYNFYNCCSSSLAESVFIWKSDDVRSLTSDFATPGLDPLYAGGSSSVPDADLRDFLNLQPIHRRAELIDLSILRFVYNNPSTPDVPVSYSSNIDYEIVVLDYFGNTKRIISQASANYKGLSDKIWTPIALTSTSSSLIIEKNELVAARISFGSPATLSSIPRLMFYLSGTGKLLS